MARRPAVSTISTSRPSRRASSRPAFAVVDRVAGLAEHRHVDLAAERAQLLDGGGALEVRADQDRVAALLLEPAGELGGVGRLARALEASHQDDRRRLRLAKVIFMVSPPSAAMSSSWTILMTCCAGFSASDSSSPMARSRMRASIVRTTLKSTSASSRATRISRRTSSTSSSREPPLAAEPLEDAVEPVGECLEHAVDRS